MEYPLLLEFLDTRLEAALDQERFNRQTIHLYRCGDSWLALEYSACLLEEQFHYKDKKPLIFHLRDGRRVVMVEVPASYVRRSQQDMRPVGKERDISRWMPVVGQVIMPDGRNGFWMTEKVRKTSVMRVIYHL